MSHDPVLWRSLLHDHMKFLDVVLWGLIIRSSSYALTLSPAQGFARNDTLALGLFNTTTSNVTSREQSCRSSYGTGLNLDSCKNAWEKIPLDSEPYIYGVRPDIAAGAHFDVGLPLRFLSEDGLCAIDIRATREAEPQLALGDSAKNIEVSEAAKVVLDQCVSIRHQGGSIAGFSQRDLLTLFITKYEPKAVCEPTSEEIPFIPFCERVLQTMPARKQKETFAFTKDRRGSMTCNVLPRVIQFREPSNLRLPIARSWASFSSSQTDVVLYLSEDGPKMRHDNFQGRTVSVL